MTLFFYHKITVKPLLISRADVGGEEMIQEYKPLYTIKEVAEILGTDVARVYEFTNNGHLPYILLGGGKQSRRVKGADLEKFINDYPTEQVTN